MRFYDFKCTACSHIDEVYETTSKSEEDHFCTKCLSLSKKKITFPNVNLRAAKGNQQAENFRTPAERRRRWNSPDPKDKI